MAVTRYERFHQLTIDELITEALNEQTERVPYHLLSVIDRIEKFQEHLMDDGLVLGTINTYVQKIKSIYKKNRVELPYIDGVNPKMAKRREYIEYKDILTKDEIKKALSHMRLPAQARALTIVQGGLSNEECNHLTTRRFLEETRKYHQCDDDIKALEWLSDENHPIIWITKLIRQKTKKPYYAVIGAEAVNKIAEAKIYELSLKHNHGELPYKLLDMNKDSFQRVCRKVNKKLGFGLVSEESKFRSHNLRRFHATYIRGGVMSYDESSRISNMEIDELQGRGKTNVQDTYIKSNPLEQKLIYAKVMNNVSLYHEYDYEVTYDDVVISVKDQVKTNKNLEKKVIELEHQLNERQKASRELENLKEKYGEDTFNAILEGILNAS